MSLQIIIPVYNTESYLDKCIDSLLIEDCIFFKNNDIQILFVNDGSTDNSLEILNEYKNKYSFVDVLDQANQGLSIARNNAISKVTSEYFMFLDSDDWLDIAKLIDLYTLTKERELDVISYRLEFYDERNIKSGEMAAQPVLHNVILDGKDVLLSNYQPSSACLFLYRTKFIRKNNLFFYPGITQQDVEFTVRMLLKAKKVYFVNTIIYKYFRRSGSTTIPETRKMLENYLNDSIIVADQIKNNLSQTIDKEMVECINRNCNSVVWNLLWRFYRNKKEVSYDFKLQCIVELKDKKLYPIRGPLKTRFQSYSRLLMNSEIFLKRAIR